MKSLRNGNFARCVALSLVAGALVPVWSRANQGFAWSVPGQRDNWGQNRHVCRLCAGERSGPDYPSLSRDRRVAGQPNHASELN